MLATTPETRITQSPVRLLMNMPPLFGTLATRLEYKKLSMPHSLTDGRHFFFNREFVDRLDDEELDFP